jgi:hypothetical protein
VIGTDRRFEERQASFQQWLRLLTIVPVLVDAREVEDEQREIAVRQARAAFGDCQSLGCQGRRQAEVSCVFSTPDFRPQPHGPEALAIARRDLTAARQPKGVRARDDRPAARRDGHYKGAGRLGRNNHLCATLTAEEVGHLSDGVTVRFANLQVDVDPVFPRSR